MLINLSRMTIIKSFIKKYWVGTAVIAVVTIIFFWPVLIRDKPEINSIIIMNPDNDYPGASVPIARAAVTAADAAVAAR